MLLNQVSTFVENTPGRLAIVTDILQDADIDIRALSIAETTDFGLVRLIVNDPEKAKSLLQRAGFTVSVTKVIGVGISDRPGGLSAALMTLQKAHISVEYMYAFVSRIKDMAFVILRVADPEAAMEVLKEAGHALLTEEYLA